MEAGRLVIRGSGGHKSAQEMVADGLREAILGGSLEGGRPLKQAEIAAQFGVSSIPVREAFRSLEGEGLVTFYPRRGAIVSELSADEVREICEMREALEVLALARALPNIAAEDLLRAEEILDLADGKSDEQLVAGWRELNWSFHEALYRPANRPRLLNAIKNLQTNLDRYLRIYLSPADYKEKGQREHRRLLERCRSGDGEGALEVLREHIRTVAEMLLVYLEEDGSTHAP